MAIDLIKLYAERESRKGFAFSEDCEMSIDFEKDLCDYMQGKITISFIENKKILVKC